MQQEDLVLKVKYHTTQPPLEFIAGKSDWIDLRASEDIDLFPGQSAIIPLGVSMRLPDGYEAHLAPRSSTFKRHGLIQTNGVGVIDNSYSGDEDIWGMPVYATREAHIERGERICQFRLMKKMDTVQIVAVDTLGTTSRGGFGSTGQK